MVDESSPTQSFQLPVEDAKAGASEQDTKTALRSHEKRLAAMERFIVKLGARQKKHAKLMNGLFAPIELLDQKTDDAAHEREDQSDNTSMCRAPSRHSSMRWSLQRMAFDAQLYGLMEAWQQLRTGGSG
ncbi:hypothetical protein LTR85_005877 [Meristemomyces frigidus]|nr:hypothetical protein LTR85_005877 [Meristemomyces frigidus]